MDVLDAVHTRRSIRRFKSQEIEPEKLRQLLEAIRWSPSWGNRQCWKFVLVRNNDLKAKLADCLRSPVAPRKNLSYLAITQAPLVVVACAQRGVSGFWKVGERTGAPATDKGEYWYMFDLGLAMETLALAAHALGLGTVHIGLFDAAAAARVINLPPDHAVVEMMPLGYPDEEPKAPARKELKDFVFQDNFGNALEVE